MPGRPPTQAYQRHVWKYYGEGGVGEFHALATYKANCLSRCRLVPGLLGDDDEPGPVFDERGNPTEGVDRDLADLALELARTLKPGIGGQGQLLAAAELNLTAVADFWLLGVDEMAADPDSPLDSKVVGRSFEVCSKQEIVPLDRGWGRRTAPGATPVRVPPGAFLRRIHRPHPEFSLYADSQMAPLLPTLERLRLLGLAGQAEALSRLAQDGVFLLAEEVDFPDDDDDSDIDPVQRNIIRAFGTPIADPSAPGAYTPYVMRLPGEVIEKKQYAFVRFDRPDFPIDTKRDAAVAAFARGVDAPPEMVTGIGAANHWSAWAIDEQAYKAYIEPDANFLAEAFTFHYWRPELVRNYGKVTDAVRRLVLMVDTADLILHPNQEAAVDTGYGTAEKPNLLVSGAYWRQARNIPESARPDDAEIAERIAIAETLRSRALVQNPPHYEGDPENPVPAAANVAPTPAGGAAGDLPSGVTAAAVTAAVLAGAVAAAVETAAERAADRISSRCRDRARAAGHADLLVGHPARQVTATLAAAGVPWGAVAKDLPPGEFEALARVVARLAAESGDRDPTAAASLAVARAVSRAFALVGSTVELSSPGPAGPRADDPLLVLAGSIAELAGRPFNLTVNNPPVTVQSPDVHVHPADVHVHPAEVTVHSPPVTVNTPDVTVNNQPAEVTVHTPEVTVNTPDVTVNAPPVTVTNQPAEITVNVPRPGPTTLERDPDGNIIRIVPED